MKPGTGWRERHDEVIPPTCVRMRGSRRSNAAEFSKTGAAGHEKGLRLAPKAPESSNHSYPIASKGFSSRRVAELSRGLSRQPENGSSASASVKRAEALFRSALKRDSEQGSRRTQRADRPSSLEKPLTSREGAETGAFRPAAAPPRGESGERRARSEPRRSA
jgi:hypothetical protein